MLTIKGHGERVILDDPALMNYLTDAFRSAKRGTPGTSVVYTGHIRFSSAGSVECYLYISEEDGVITLSEPLHTFTYEPSVYYRVTLPRPIPEPLAKLLTHLWD